jgi:hypothetical protein
MEAAEMRSSVRACAIFACVALSFLRGSPFSPAATPVVDVSPAKLVLAALESELAGSPQDRARLLAEALAIDPNFAPARWQSGFVRIGDEWIKIDDVPKRVAGDSQLTAYQKLRDSLVDTADHHRELARWCKKNRLPLEERVHWSKVLEFEGQDAEALEALGLEWHAGRLMTAAQIAQEKLDEAQRQRDRRRWQTQIAAWRRAIERGNAQDRDAALESLKNLDDSAAIPSLEAVLIGTGEGHFHAVASTALVEAIGRMPTPTATQSLVRTAVFGEPQELRTLAAGELKKRPMHAYVPQLIAALPGSLKTRFNVFLLSDGTVIHEHEVLFAGRQANWSMTFESTVAGDMLLAPFMAPRAAGREIARAARIESQAQAAEKQLAFVRERVQTALQLATGFTKVDEPELWERQYNDYYGLLSPESKPTYRAYNKAYEGYVSLPIDEKTTITRTLTDDIPINRTWKISCFPAGTIVWTMAGPRPIEKIKVGDRVLSQNPTTGEQLYEPVQTTTLRAPTPLLKIDLDAESILATPGHPFWVVGEGWRIARQLEPGALLHCADGTVRVNKIESSRSSEVYNFVVSDLHNYFVGSSRVLVHDNSPLAELAQRVPGLASTKR